MMIRREVLSSGFVQVTHWEGPGWYAPVQEGRDPEGRHEIHDYLVSQSHDRDGYDKEGEPIWNSSRLAGLGTPAWIGSLEKLDKLAEDVIICPDCAGQGMVLGSTGPTGDDPERPCERCDMTGRV